MQEIMQICTTLELAEAVTTAIYAEQLADADEVIRWTANKLTGLFCTPTAHVRGLHKEI